ncbi:gamma-tubulin complex component 3 [Neocloeon triangulifer]|uniref:gamma-tubulin complex component 3 n=1 Tax=Neocloeon triangulifer TaxID=2078957 RepID=UPI00286EDDED|nr:gamma-tubulin complex component 3 [Neocloeon triangulifer]
MATSKKISDESLQKLCKAGTAKQPGNYAKWYAYVCQELGNAPQNPGGSGDFDYSIEQHLLKENRQEDLLRYAELKRKLYETSVVEKKEELLRFFTMVSYFRVTGVNKKNRMEKVKAEPENDFKQPNPEDFAFLRHASIVDCPVDRSPGFRRSFSPLRHVEQSHSYVSRRESYAESICSNVSARSAVRPLEGRYSQNDLIREVMFVFNGVGGSIFKDDCGDGTFRISQKLEDPLRQQAAHLAEIGTLNFKIRKMVESVPHIGAPYCLSALVGAVRDQLHEFSRLITNLESELRQASRDNPMSLLQVRIITHQPKCHLQWLSTVANECKDKKGGALLSNLHSLVQHGDPKVREWLQPLLSAAAAPFYEILSEWLERGTIKDPHTEFFISVDNETIVNNFWHRKYSIRESMKPSFISQSQANMVLTTGKSVAFLTQCCGKSPKDFKIPGLQEAIENGSDKLWDVDGALQVCIEAAHKSFSKEALNVMLHEGKLALHLQAMRRYMLLGSGDFIKLLMEFSADELNKKADQLMAHTLTPKLESAIRATNAQYEDEDVLNRLDIKLLYMTNEETGWDIFSLQYCIDGPIAMVFPPEVKFKYLSLFNALWRAKRMEWLLSNMWRSQAISARELRKMTEIGPLIRELSVLISEMNQFMRQMQYYLLFECVECQWSLLQKAIAQAASLDDIIHAHNKFLDNIMKSCLLDEESQHLTYILRRIYNNVLDVSKLEASFDKLINTEFQRRKELDKQYEMLEEASMFGLNKEDEAREKQAQKEFENAMTRIRVSLMMNADGYRERVKEFLLALASHPNEDLQFLSLRLDFNEYYKTLDKRLSTPHTLSYRRRSSLMPPFAAMTVSAEF